MRKGRDNETREGSPLTFVRPGHNPGWRVADAQIEDLSNENELVERLHYLLDRRGEIEPMNVENVDIICSQLLQAGSDGSVKALGRVSGKAGMQDALLVDAETVAVLGRDDHFLAAAAGLQPLSNPALRVAALVVVGRIDKVAAVLLEVVEHSESRILRAFAKDVVPRCRLARLAETSDPDYQVPFAAKVHGSKAKRAHENTCLG